MGERERDLVSLLIRALITSIRALIPYLSAHLNLITSQGFHLQMQSQGGVRASIYELGRGAQLCSP